jgi:hypothetical protein
MKIKNLTEGLNAQQQSVPQLPAQAQARHISVLGAKKDPKHPFAGYAVGANEGVTKQQVNEIDAVQLQHLQKFSQQVSQMTPAELEALNQYIMSVGLGSMGAVAGTIGAFAFSDMFMSVMNRTMRLAKKKTEVDAEEIIKLQRQIVSIHKRLKTLKSEPAIAKYQDMLKQAYEVLEELEARQGNQVAEGERNEMDTDAVQAALKKMAERHQGEKWTKEQLAALGKRIAARGQKPVKEGDIVKTPTGLIHKGKYGTSYYDPKNKNEPGTNKVGRPVKSTGRDVSIDEPRQIRRNQPGYMEKTPRITNPDAPRSPVRKTGPIAGGGLDIDLPKHVQDRIFAQSEFDRFKSNPGIVRVKPKDDGVAILDLDETSQEDVDEGWKSKLAGAALAGAAALGGGGASAADVNDPSWSKAGYDSHVKADSSLTKTTSADGVSAPKVTKDLQRRISDVTGPNADGQYRVTVTQNGKLASQYVTKTPPPGWMVKESADNITKEDIISKLKARLGDYLSDISKEIKKDPDLVDKLAAAAPGDQMGPPVKTVTTDDGKEIQIHGNEDDGFRISIKNKPAQTQFESLDHAVMACEMYCTRRRDRMAGQSNNSDYLDEA